MFSDRIRIVASLLVFACFAIASPAWAQVDFNVLTTEADKVPPRKMLHAYLIAETQKHFNARRLEIAKLATPDDVRKRQAIQRERLLAALGEFPAKTPLKPQIVGKEQRDGYRIEKLIYESRPDHHVTATLYLPDGKGPFPGCIMPIGHSNNGKAAEYIQRGSILLVKNGIAVLTYDPIGQGERKQLLDGLNKAAIPSSTNEHTLIHVGAMLVGQTTATYRIWDGIRSLDYLVSRPEIDASRLGCTGCSGGGTLTSYLMAIDDRIVCAAPSCYITTLERLFATIGPQDGEQNITGQVALGIDHADFIFMRAPRPTLLATATQDFFDIQGSWTSFREASQIYGILGHSERVNLVEYNTKHGYPKPQREAVTRWMSRWLLGKDVPIVEPAFNIAKDADLQCTRSGQVLEDLKGKSVFNIVGEYEQRYAKNRGETLAKQPPETTRKEIARLLGLPTTPIPPAKSEVIGQAGTIGKITYKKMIFETERGIRLPAIYFHTNAPVPALTPIAIYCNGLGKTSDMPAIERLLAKGQNVVAVDLRGMGEVAPSMPNAKPGNFGNDYKETFIALHLNRPLLGQRVFDLQSVISALQGTNTTPRPIHVVGVGAAGPIVLHAAALDARITSASVEDAVLSWAAVVRSPINYNQLTNVVPGALKVYDLPDLASLVAPRPLTLYAVDPQGGAIPLATQQAAYAGARAAYVRLNATDKFSLGR